MESLSLHSYMHASCIVTKGEKHIYEKLRVLFLGVEPMTYSFGGCGNDKHMFTFLFHV